jgi:hypothetical protein
MVVANNEIDVTKNAGKSTMISTTMRMRWCDAGRITRWSTSRASLEATGCRHRASARIAPPRRPPWSTTSNKTHKTLTKHNFKLANTVHFERYLLVRISYPKTDPLLSSSMRQALLKCETPRLELKSSRSFLAIKRFQRTKSKKLLTDHGAH